MTGRPHHRDDKTPLGWAWYGRLYRSHHPKEDTDVLPPPCDRMDHHTPCPLAPLDQITSHGLGSVEPGDGVGAPLCVDRRQYVPGHVAALKRRRRASAVARGAPGDPTGLDGPWPGGSGLVRPLAVSAHYAAGVAPVFAHQHWGHVSSHGSGARGPSEDVGARARDDVAGHRHRLQRPQPAAALYAAGVLGSGLHRSLVAPDRSAAGGQHGLLVWLAGLD